MSFTPGSFGGPPDPRDRLNSDNLENSSWRPPNLSTTQILVTIVVVAAVIGLVAEVFRQSTPPDVAIVGPTNGDEMPVGGVSVAIRVEVADLTNWELTYSGPDTGGAWQMAASGHYNVGRMTGGSYQLEFQQPGQYHLRLVAHRDGSSDVQDTADIRLTP